MTYEQFAELAYNTYCESRLWKSVKGDPLPKWNDQHLDLRLSWILAIKAVVDAMNNSKPEQQG